MSFNSFRSTIKEDDTVILYVSFNQMHPIKASKQITNKKGNLIDNIFQTTYGALRCEDLIGKEFGSKITLSKGHVFVLQPTPELWTLTLPHRTQIIYTPDISMIVHQLELSPTSIVIESGTGSASLSHALIRTIKPKGHLYTFDFHQERANTARQEFKEHGYGDFVSVAHRDVCANGFGNEVDNKADAVFLDLPHPWLAIGHAVKAIKQSGGRICSFSPCIEQVQRTCLSLRELSFVEVESMEVLQTQLSVQNRNMTSLNFDFVKTEKADGNEEDAKHEKQTVRIVTALPPATQAGHTGFLTFATLPPIWARHFKLADDNSSD